MPPKTITCSICGDEVTKRQSYAIGDGKRACRSHEETQSLANEAQQKIVADSRRRSEELKKKLTPRFKNEPITFVPKCLVCNEEGMRQDIFFTSLLLAMEKYHLTYGTPLNIFNPEEARKAYAGLKRCLWVIAYSGENIPKINRLNNGKFIGEMLGFVCVCGECCEARGLKKPELPKLEFEDLNRHAVAFDTFVRPTLRDIAKRELEAKN